MSYLQEQMWTLYELDRSSAAYNSIKVYWLQGELHAEQLSKSVAFVAASQSSLRTRYGYGNDGAPLQWIVPDEKWMLPMYECSVGTMNEAKELLRFEVMSACHQLEHGVGWMLLIHVPKDKNTDTHMVVFNTHHIATDGISNTLRWLLVCKSYNLLVNGSQHAAMAVGGLQPPAIGYADFALWQRQHLDSEQQEHLLWWKSTLEDAPLLELQPDYARPLDMNHSGGSVPVVLDGAKHLRRRAQGHRATEMHGVLALWAVVLCIHTGQADVVVGTVYENRSRIELQEIIGYFVNTLAVLVHIDRDSGFDAVLQGARNAMIDALEHGEMPFLKVVEVVLQVCLTLQLALYVVTVLRSTGCVLVLTVCMPFREAEI